MGKMRVAKLRVGILRVEVRASTRLVSYFYNNSQFTRRERNRAQQNFRTGNKTCIGLLTHNTCVCHVRYNNCGNKR